MVLTPEISRGARGLLDWTQEQLATCAGVSRSTVRDFECGRHVLHRATELAMVQALDAAGVEIIAEEDGGPGVRLVRDGLRPVRKGGTGS